MRDDVDDHGPLRSDVEVTFPDKGVDCVDHYNHELSTSEGMRERSS